MESYPTYDSYAMQPKQTHLEPNLQLRFNPTCDLDATEGFKTPVATHMKLIF
jgi:hypothetical protein